MVRLLMTALKALCRASVGLRLQRVVASAILELLHQERRIMMIQKWSVVALLVVMGLVLGGCAAPKHADTAPEDVKRVGQVIGLKAKHLKDYKRLHSPTEPGVRELLNKYHIHNFSIFLTQIEGQWYEFAYYEYTGDNYDKDMTMLANEPRNIAWLNKTDPMQRPLQGEDGWRQMETVYFNP
jgi:L-rhamnose mutarotase